MHLFHDDIITCQCYESNILIS